MLAYIRNPQNWSAVKVVTAISYELPVEVAQGESGSITIAGRLDADYSRYMISVENSTEIYKITGQQFGSASETTITIEDYFAALEDCVCNVPKTRYAQYAQGGIISWDMLFHCFFASSTRLWSNYAPQGFRIVQNSDQDFVNYLNGLMIPLSELTVFGENGSVICFYFSEIFRVLRKYGVVIHASVPNEDLQISFDIGHSDNQAIHFEDGHSQLITESYNDDVCTGCIIYDGSIQPFYLDDYGEIVSEVLEQAQGYTVSLWRDGSFTTAFAQAQEHFNKNQHSHKIEFASDREFHIGQVVRLITQRGIITSKISKVVKKSNDDRIHYTCGEFPVTAKERIRADSWSYGSRLPNNPYTGQLFLEV